MPAVQLGTLRPSPTHRHRFSCLSTATGKTPSHLRPTLQPSSAKAKRPCRAANLSLAEEDFRRVIALDPKSSAAHVNLGVAYMREKRWDDALVELHKAESLSPDEPGIRLNIGLAYYRKNDFAAAIEPFSAALQRAPEFAAGEISPGALLFLYE